MFCRRKHRHIRTDFREQRNGGHNISGKTGDCLQQFQLIRVLLRQTKDFFFDIGFMGFLFIQVLQTFPKLYSLFVGYGPIDSSLNFFNGVLAAPVDERRDIKGFTGMLQDVVDNGT